MAEEDKKKTDEKKTKETKQDKPKTVKKTVTKKAPVRKPTAKKETPTKKKADTKKPEIKAKTEKAKTAEKPKAKTIKKAEPKKVTKKPETQAKKEIKEEVEEKEDKKDEEYKVKIKPKLTKEKQQRIKIRKQIKNRTPEFLREEWFRYKRIPHNWRRPDGITSKMRINRKYRPSRVRVGFRGPKETRGLHSSGFEEIMIYNVNDLKQIKKEAQAARIGSSVGTKKRLEIEKKPEELEVRILNI